MSKTDIFSKYSQLYQKSQAKEIIPSGALVRQLVDIPRQSLDVGIFFKSKGIKNPRQVHLGNPIPMAVAKKEGFLETTDSTYFSRTLISKFKTLDYLRVVISAGTRLESKDSRVAFLKRCRKIIDVILRKARNVIHQGDFDAFLFAKKIRTLNTFLNKELKLDEISAEAASIPFNVAAPEYIVLSDERVIVLGKEPKVAQAVFFFVGGIGYTFDNKLGAVNEERLFRSTTDLSPIGIDPAYIETQIARITDDFQNNIHSLIFSDVWKKGKTKPMAVNMGGDLLIKAEPSSDIWQGIFEVYLKSPKA
ncbi:MAG: hypothetical protein ACTSV2_06045 [Candidatus Thorarchaeota archaeon]